MPATTPQSLSAADRMSGLDADEHNPSLDRFASELSAMIDVASATAEAMNQRVRDAGDIESRAGAMSTQLQEQLRLGARMLSAFQTQVVRVEAVLGRQHAYAEQVEQTQAKIEQCFAGIDACIDTTLTQVALRLAEQARLAMERFDEGVAARQQRLADMDARIERCASGIDELCDLVERARADIINEGATHRDDLEKLAAAAQDARTLLGQHDSARRSLAVDLQAAHEELQVIQRACTRVDASMREVLSRGEQADAAMRERLDRFDQARSESAVLEQRIADLRALMLKLAPWEPLLLSSNPDADGLPRPLADLAGEVRRRVSEDMNWLNLTMRDVSQRVAQLAAAGLGPAAPAQAPAERENPEPAPLAVKRPLRIRTFDAGA